MKMRLTANCRNRRGAAAVEMAIVTPVFLLLAFGIIEFGRGLMVSNLVTIATREGARQAIVDGSTNAEETAAIQSFMPNA